MEQLDTLLIFLLANPGHFTLGRVYNLIRDKEKETAEKRVSQRKGYQYLLVTAVISRAQSTEGSYGRKRRCCQIRSLH
jgi:hypothetical protein